MMKARLLAAMFVALLMVGCGGPDLDDKETLDEIIAEAIDWGKLQEKGEEGDQLYYAPNQQTPYTGWVKAMWGNEQVRVLAQYEDGKRDGLQTSWHENGQKEIEGNWKDGKEDGLFTMWYESGQKWEVGNWKDGKRDGLGKTWHENGQKWSEVNYKDGKEDGLWTMWYENGQNGMEGNCKDGKFMSAVRWKPNGEKCPVTNVEYGNGFLVWYNYDGTESSRDTYEDGEIVED